VPFSPQIAVEAVQLPPSLDGDPADQILVATARVLGIPLLTADRRLIDYPHVTTI
jgi:PIN domain nuclease of toxin-antitoxin system